MLGCSVFIVYINAQDDVNLVIVWYRSSYLELSFPVVSVGCEDLGL